MKHTLKKLSYIALSLVVATGVIVGLRSGFDSAPGIVQAGANHNFTGFAWSDMPTTSNEVTNPTGGTVGRGAGWISFNSIDTSSSIDYGVNATAGAAGTYTISGNAWSEHLGWISFGSTSGCPTNNGTNCQPRLEPTTAGCTSNCSYAFKGWARATAGLDTAGAGGWDGWISLSSTNHSGSVAYGWSLNTAGNVSGSAWGGDILGWINPYNLNVNLQLNNPTLILDANPASISSANPLVTDLTYKVENWSGAGSPYSSCTFTTNPTSGGGTAGTPVNGTVISAANNLPISTNRSITNVRVYNPSSNQTVYTLTCTPIAGGATVSDTATVFVTDPQPAATITGPGCVINPGTSAQLVWTSANVTSCTINNGIGQLANLNGNTAVTVSSTTSYTISCTGPYGPVSDQHTIAVNPSCQQTSGGGGNNPIFNEI